MSVGTGVPRLDELLGGGLRERSFALLHAPPFLGKDLLSDGFLLAGVDAGEPSILVLTNETWQDARERLLSASPRARAAEAAGLLHFIDAYSYQLDPFETPPPAHVHLVDGVQNLSDIALAANEAHRAVAPDGRAHRVVFSSASTLVAQTNPQTVFRFLQTFIARARRAGGTGLTLLEHGMHSSPDVEAFKSLHHGVIEMKQENERRLLRVDGLGVHASPGWVEFRQTERRIELIGSFAGGRIR